MRVYGGYLEHKIETIQMGKQNETNARNAGGLNDILYIQMDITRVTTDPVRAANRYVEVKLNEKSDGNVYIGFYGLMLLLTERLHYKEFWGVLHIEEIDI